MGLIAANLLLIVGPSLVVLALLMLVGNSNQTRVISVVSGDDGRAERIIDEGAGAGAGGAGADGRARRQRLLLRSVVLGMLAVVPVLGLAPFAELVINGLRFDPQSFAGILFSSVIVGAAVEELFKFAALSVATRRRVIRSDIVISATAVAIGFAFIENCWYLTGRTPVAALRGSITVAIHIAATQVAALALGRTASRPIRAVFALMAATVVHGSYNVVLA